MEYEALIKRRQSCREYSGVPVAREVLEKIVAAGCIAPSACNMQPWHLYVAQGDSLKDFITALNPKFSGIGAAILACEVPKPLPFSPENPYRQMDIGLCVMQMALAAENEGLASCIVGSFDKNKMRQLFSIAEEEIPRLVLVLGTAVDATVRPKERLTEGTVSWL